MKPVAVLKKLDLVSWPTLLFGWKKGWVEKSDIADYATYLLSVDLDNDDKNIAVLAGADFSDESEIENIMLKVSGSTIEPEAIEKWRLATLIALNVSTLSDEEKLNKLQELYAEFDYPEDMSSCSIYSQDSVDPLTAMSDVISALTEKISGSCS